MSKTNVNAQPAKEDDAQPGVLISPGGSIQTIENIVAPTEAPAAAVAGAQVNEETSNFSVNKQMSKKASAPNSNPVNANKERSNDKENKTERKPKKKMTLRKDSFMLSQLQYKQRHSDSLTAKKFSNKDLRQLLLETERTPPPHIEQILLNSQTLSGRKINMQSKQPIKQLKFTEDIKEHDIIENEVEQICKVDAANQIELPNCGGDQSHDQGENSNASPRQTSPRGRKTEISPKAMTSGRQYSSALDRHLGQRLRTSEEHIDSKVINEYCGHTPQSQNRVIFTNLKTPIQDQLQNLDPHKTLSPNQTPQNRSKNLVAFSFMQGDQKKRGSLLKKHNGAESMDDQQSKKGSVDGKPEDETTQKTVGPNASNKKFQNDLLEAIPHNQTMNNILSSEGSQQRKNGEKGEYTGAATTLSPSLIGKTIQALQTEFEILQRYRRERAPAERVPMVMNKISLQDAGAGMSKSNDQLKQTGYLQQMGSLEDFSIQQSDQNSKAHFTFLPPQAHQIKAKKQQNKAQDSTDQAGSGKKDGGARYRKAAKSNPPECQINTRSESASGFEKQITPSYLIGLSLAANGKLIKEAAKSPYVAKSRVRHQGRTPARVRNSKSQNSGSSNGRNSSFKVGSPENPSVIIQPMSCQKVQNIGAQPPAGANQTTEQSKIEQKRFLTNDSKENGSVSFGNSIKANSNLSNYFLSSAKAAVTPTITGTGPMETPHQALVPNHQQNAISTTPIQVVLPPAASEVAQFQRLQTIDNTIQQGKLQVATSKLRAINSEEEQSQNHLLIQQAFRTESGNSKQAVHQLESGALNIDIKALEAFTQKGNDDKGKSENTKDGIELKKMVLYDGKTGKVLKLNRSSERSEESKASEEDKSVMSGMGMVYNTNRRYIKEDASKSAAPRKEELLLNKLQLVQMFKLANNPQELEPESDKNQQTFLSATGSKENVNVRYSPQTANLSQIKAIGIDTKSRHDMQPTPSSPLQNQKLRSNIDWEPSILTGIAASAQKIEENNNIGPRLQQSDQQKRQIIIKKSMTMTAALGKENDSFTFLDKKANQADNTFIQTAVEPPEYDQMQSAEMAAKNNLLVESQRPQMQNGSLKGAKTDQNYSQSKATPLAQMYHKPGQDAISAFNMQEQHDADAPNGQQSGRLDRRSPQIADIRIEKSQPNQRANLVQNNQSQRKYAATSQGFVSHPAAPFIPNQKLKNSTFRLKAGKTFQGGRKSNPRRVAANSQERRSSSSEREDEKAAPGLQILNFKKDDQQQISLKFTTTRPTSLAPSGPYHLLSPTHSFLPQLRTPNEPITPAVATGGGVGASGSASPSAAFILPRQSNLPTPSSRLQQQTLAAYVTSIVTQAEKQRQQVKIQVSGDHMIDKVRLKMQMGTKSPHGVDAANQAGPPKQPHFEEESVIMNSFNEDTTRGRKHRKRIGGSAIPGVSEAGISTIIDKDSMTRKLESDDAKFSNQVTNQRKRSRHGQEKMSQQINKNEGKEGELFGSINRGKSKYEENQSSVNQGSLRSDDTNKQRKQDADVQIDNTMIDGKDKDANEKSLEETSLEQEVIALSTYHHNHQQQQENGRQQARREPHAGAARPAHQQPTKNITVATSGQQTVAEDKVSQLHAMGDDDQRQVESQLGDGFSGIDDVSKGMMHSDVQTPISKERGSSEMVESKHHGKYKQRVKGDWHRQRERLVKNKRVSMINDRGAFGLIRQDNNDSVFNSFFAKTPVQDRATEFNDPLSPVTPQTPLLSLANQTELKKSNFAGQIQDEQSKNKSREGVLLRPGMLPIVKKKLKITDTEESLQNMTPFKLMNNDVSFPFDQLYMRQAVEHSKPPYYDTRNKTPFPARKSDLQQNFVNMAYNTQTSTFQGLPSPRAASGHAKSLLKTQASPSSSFNPNSGAIQTILINQNSEGAYSQEPSPRSMGSTNQQPLANYQLHTIKGQEGIINKSIKKIFISKDQLHTIVSQGLQLSGPPADPGRKPLASPLSSPKNGSTLIFQKGKRSMVVQPTLEPLENGQPPRAGQQQNDEQSAKRKRTGQTMSRNVNLPALMQDRARDNRKDKTLRTLQAARTYNNSNAKIPDLIPVRHYLKEDGKVAQRKEKRPLVAELQQQLPNDCFKNQNILTAVEATQRAHQIIKMDQLQRKKSSKISNSEQQMLIMRALKSVHTSTAFNNFSAQNTSIIGEMQLQNSSDMTTQHFNIVEQSSQSIQDKLLNVTLTSTVNSPSGVGGNQSVTFHNNNMESQGHKSKSPFLEPSQTSTNHDGPNRSQLLKQLKIQQLVNTTNKIDQDVMNNTARHSNMKNSLYKLTLENKSNTFYGANRSKSPQRTAMVASKQKQQKRAAVKRVLGGGRKGASNGVAKDVGTQNLRASPDNSGSGGVGSNFVDLDNQLKHIYTDINKPERSHEESSSRELSNAPIRQVRVATKQSTSKVLKLQNVLNSPKIKEDIKRSGDTIEGSQERAQAQRNMMRKLPDNSRLQNKRNQKKQDIEEVTMQTVRKEIVTPIDHSSTISKNMQTQDRMAIAALASSRDASVSKGANNDRGYLESTLGEGSTPKAPIKKDSKNIQLYEIISHEQQRYNKGTGGFRVKGTNHDGLDQELTSQYSNLDPRNQGDLERGWRYLTANNPSAPFEHQQSMTQQYKLNPHKLEKLRKEIEFTKRQNEELKNLQLILQQDQHYQAPDPIDAVRGKSFTSTYDISRFIGQGGRDQRLMNLEQKYITNRHRKSPRRGFNSGRTANRHFSNSPMPLNHQSSQDTNPIALNVSNQLQPLGHLMGMNTSHTHFLSSQSVSYKPPQPSQPPALPQNAQIHQTLPHSPLTTNTLIATPAAQGGSFMNQPLTEKLNADLPGASKQT